MASYRETWRDEHLGVSYEMMWSGVWSWTVFVPAFVLKKPGDWARMRMREDVTLCDIVTKTMRGEKRGELYDLSAETYLALGDTVDDRVAVREHAKKFIELLISEFPGLADGASGPAAVAPSKEEKN